MKKRLLSLLICLALLVAAAPFALGEAAQPALPQIGETLHGFLVKETYEIENLSTTCVLMEHQKTGALLVYMANDNTERSFSVTFKTPATNDKGIPHVFEHSTLCGSEKYPEPSLFFSMMSNTYNTFLNAMTYGNCTAYPSASLSEDQLYKFVDYYLSGVYYPLIMTDERAMMREAYRYELADRDSDITLTGTVYSEMQGALTQTAMAQYNLLKQLYPGSNLSNVSGGLPADIPTITYEELKAFHDRYYHPSNSLMVLFGKVDLERFLALIDGEYLSKFDKREIVIADSGYTPLTGYTEQTYAFPVAEDTPEQTIAYYGITMRGLSLEDQFLFANLCPCLGLAGTPLDTLMRERLPGVTYGPSFSTEGAEPTLLIAAIGLEADQVALFKDTVDEALSLSFGEGGISRQSLHDYAYATKYADRLAGESYNVGVSYAGLIYTNWATYGDPDAYQTKLDVQKRLDEYIDAGAFERIGNDYLVHPVNAAIAVTTTQEGGLEEQDAALRQQLQELKAGMSDAEIDALIARTADFADWTERNKDVTLLSEIKAVDVATLPEELKRYTAADTTVDGVRYITCEADTAGIATLNTLVDTSFLTAEELPYYGMAVALLGKLPTENRTLDELQLAFTTTTMYRGSHSAITLDYADGSYTPVFQSRWKCFNENVNAAFDLLEEALLRTRYDDLARIRQYASSWLQNNTMMASAAPSTVCNAYAQCYLSESARYDAYLYGTAYEALMESIADMTDEELVTLMARVQDVWHKALNRNGLIITCVGDRAAIDAAMARGQAFAATLDGTPRERADLSAALVVAPEPLAIEVTGTVQYNMQILPMRDSDIAMNGKYLALSSLVYDKLLIPILRFENSAYGAMEGISKDSVYIMSYRDPNLAKTYETYKTLGDRLRETTFTQEELDGYIVSAYTKLAMPYGPITGGSMAVQDAILGENTFDEMLQQMREIKQFIPEDVSAFAGLFDQLAEKGFRVTVGGAQAIEEAGDFFQTVDTHYVE